MSAKRQMKKIDLETLEGAERRISIGKLKKTLAAAAIVLALSGGGYAAFRAITGDVVASRFAVNKMNCPACVITVKEVTAKLPGVIGADVSLAAQDVTIRYRSKQTNAKQIMEAIAKAGYPVEHDATFNPRGAGNRGVVLANVNNRPVFRKDMKISLTPEGKSKESDIASAFFSAVGKEIILQFADTKTIISQPYEIEEEIEKMRKAREMSKDDFAADVAKRYGSFDKFVQITAQALAVRKLLDEQIRVKDTKERERKTLEWIGALFKDAEVEIVDSDFREKLHASVGESTWRMFWPRMIGRDTDLRTVLVR